jgi:hypothetical protein
MRKTYRASVFASCYFGVLVFLAVLWAVLWSDVPHAARIWGTFFLVMFSVFGVPIIFARVTIDDSGIEQQFFTRRSVTWGDIISWQRLGFPDSDCPDTITVETRRGPFRFNGICVFGKRLAEVEAELRRRVRSVS